MTLLRNLLLISLVALPAASQEHTSRAASTPLFPPLIEWRGESRKIVAAPNDPWITPAERSHFTTTPDYATTAEFLRKLAGSSKQLRLASIGKSAEGRDIWMVVATREGASNAAGVRANGRPTILAQGGIHAGEIDGKDAGLMLLRDIARGKRDQLLDRVNLLFVPIFNVDGHERASRFSRVNQRGPENAGWRTTAQNLNLNRDYMKADSPEMRAMVGAIDEWQPDMYVDLHVTDGSDYQYDITWGYNGPHAHSPSVARYLDEVVTPAATGDLKTWGHVPGPLVFQADDADPSKGILDWTSDPRFSHGYADVRHIAGILVENHSLKPYEQRVLGTYVLLESLMRTVGSSGARLRSAIASDRAARRATVPLSWKLGDQPPRMIDFLGIESRLAPSSISGGLRIEYLGKPKTVRVPVLVSSAPAATVQRPKAYLVPSTWREVIERLRMHGVAFETLRAPLTREVTMYRLNEPKFSAEPFEGRFTVTVKPATERRRETFPAGSIRVPTDQPLGDLAVLLLEPASPDSFLQWGFFHSVFSRTEYIEGYIVEPMAEAMLRENPALAAEFNEKLKDEKFRSDARERLQWFYRQTPFIDERWRLYPVAREE